RELELQHVNLPPGAPFVRWRHADVCDLGCFWKHETSVFRRAQLIGEIDEVGTRGAKAVQQHYDGPVAAAVAVAAFRQVCPERAEPLRQHCESFVSNRPNRATSNHDYRRERNLSFDETIESEICF